MGPTNLALVKLFRADQTLRAAQERYDTAARSVRLLERRVNDLSTRLKALQLTLKEEQTKAASQGIGSRASSFELRSSAGNTCS